MTCKRKLIKTLTASALVLACTITGASALNVGYVNANSLNFRQSDSTQSAVIGKLKQGAPVAVLESGSEWSKIATGGLTGFVSSQYIKNYDTDEDFNIGTGIVTGNNVNARQEPNTTSKVLFQADKGASVEVIGISNGWYKVKSNSFIAYMHPDYISIARRESTTSRGDADRPSSSSLRQSVLATAATKLGAPYSYGSKGPNSFDCSGFTYWVFKQHGITLASSSTSQYSSTTRVSKANLLPGDLVFFSNGSSGSKVGHVGIYTGDGKFIHSPSAGKTVCYSSLSSSYYSSHYIGAGRVIFE